MYCESPIRMLRVREHIAGNAARYLTVYSRRNKTMYMQSYFTKRTREAKQNSQTSQLSLSFCFSDPKAICRVAILYPVLSLHASPFMYNVGLVVLVSLMSTAPLDFLAIANRICPLGIRRLFLPSVELKFVKSPRARPLPSVSPIAFLERPTAPFCRNRRKMFHFPSCCTLQSKVGSPLQR